MKIKVIARLNDLKDGMGKAFENFAIKGDLKVDDKTTFRCTKIEVSKEVDDYFWKYYTDILVEKYPDMEESEIRQQIAMLMLMNGAKRNEELGAWEVEMDEEFVDNGE